MNWRYISYIGFGFPSLLSVIFSIDLLESIERPIPRYAGFAFLILAIFLVFICFRFRDNKKWSIVALTATIVSLPMAVLAMSAAWGHNPGQEFHGSNGVAWVHWISVGSSWFLAMYIVIFVLLIFSLSIYLLMKRFKERARSNQSFHN